MDKKALVFAAFVATLTAIAQKYLLALLGIVAMGALANLLGIIAALRGVEKVSGSKALLGTARLVFYLAFYLLVMIALEPIASYIVPPLLSVGFLYEATITLRKAVQAGIIPHSFVEKFLASLQKHDREAS